MFPVSSLATMLLNFLFMLYLWFPSACLSCYFRVQISVSLSQCLSCFVFPRIFRVVCSQCFSFLNFSFMYFGFPGLDLLHRVLTDADFEFAPFLDLLCMTLFWTLVTNLPAPCNKLYIFPFIPLPCNWILFPHIPVARTITRSAFKPNKSPSFFCVAGFWED